MRNHLLRRNMGGFTRWTGEEADDGGAKESGKGN